MSLYYSDYKNCTLSDKIKLWIDLIGSTLGK